MDNNNNIEDFFNNSMDQFNDGPPDSVWDGIGNKLDQSKTPFYKGIKFWTVLGILFLVGGFVIYAFYTQNKINTLLEKTDELELQNIGIESQLLECGENSNRLINIINDYQVEKENKAKKQQIIPGPIPQKIEVIPSPPVQENTSNEIGFIQPIENASPVVIERILPKELNDQIDSIIHNNPEMIDEEVKMVKVPIYSYDDTVKVVEIEAIKPDVKGSMKDWFDEKKEKLENRKWKIFKKRNKDEEN